MAFQIGGAYRSYDTGESGYTYFPISELHYPLATRVAQIMMKEDVSPTTQLRAQFGYNTGATSDSMKDSDWGILSHNMSSLDVYSESDVELDTEDWRIEIVKEWTRYRREKWIPRFGFGVLHQYYVFTVSNTVQWSPSDPTLPVLLFPGIVNEYHYRAVIPYFLIEGAYRKTDRLEITGSIVISPLAYVRDHDDHLLRRKVSDGDSEGYMAMVSFLARYSVRHWISLYIEFEHQNLRANGVQHQISYETGVLSESKIGLRNISEQSQFRFGVQVTY